MKCSNCSPKCPATVGSFGEGKYFHRSPKQPAGGGSTIELLDPVCSGCGCKVPEPKNYGRCCE